MENVLLTILRSRKIVRIAITILGAIPKKSHKQFKIKTITLKGAIE